MSSADHAVVCRRVSGRNLESAVEVVNSFEFDARIRDRPPLRPKRTLLADGSKTKAPLLPTLRKSFASPFASLLRETAVWAAVAPCAMGVLNALSGPFGRA